MAAEGEGRHGHYRRALGDKTCAAVAGARVLVVGAGGIGCELLKNLVLAGFRDIEVVDLDTIDVSNLNRQFLFRARHVGQSKAQVAVASAGAMDSNARLQAHHANVKDSRFSVAYVAAFHLVFMALDNVEARRHVNRLCLAADVPLLESGTAGYLGQVQVIRRGVSECYDCREKPRQKTYPYCTIHNTPSKPVHTVIWAKVKFSDAFSRSADAVTSAAPDEEEALDAASDESLAAEDQIVAALLRTDFGRGLFRRLFHRDALKRRLLASLRPAPAATEGATAAAEAREPPPPRLPPTAEALAAAEAEERDTSAAEATGATADGARLAEQRLWGSAETVRRFLEASTRLQARVATSGAVEWDKDDSDAMEWVTAAANIRSEMFGITPQSLFDVKAMAGNIIPAIATTNAVIAGLLVLEALRILAGHPDDCRYTYLLQRPSGKRVLLDMPLPLPNPACFVCQSSWLQVRVDTAATTLGAFVRDVLQARLGLFQPALYVADSCVYECGDDLEEDERRDMEELALRPMRDVRLGPGALVRVEDDGQSLSLDVSIAHAEGENEDGSTWFEVEGKANDAISRDSPADTDADDAVMEEADSRKRKAAPSDEEPSAKRKR